MKKYLALMCVAALSACGGGSSSPSTQSTPTQAPKSAQALPSADAASALPVAAKSEKSESGKQFFSGTNSSDSAVAFNHADWNKITVEGVEVDLAAVQGESFKNGWRDSVGGSENKRLANFGGNYVLHHSTPDAVAGIVKTESQNNYAFFNGNFTREAEMPKIGQAVYDVSTVSVRGTLAQAYGTGRLTADFESKKVSGSLGYFNKTLTVDADINGNRFSSVTPTAEIHGGFFGSAAAETAGVYQVGKIVGTFAGQKQ